MIYDYKSDELTQEVYITCIHPIVDDIIDEYSTIRRYENLSIYAPAYIAKEILGKLLDEIEDLWVHNDSENELLYEYDNEVLITIANDGMVFVEEAKENGAIKSNEDCCLTYIYDSINHKDVSILEENAESILIFGFEGDDCEGCKSDDSDDKELASTSNKSYYIDGKEVSKDAWEKEHKKIIDEIETFRRGFWDDWVMF